MAAGGDDGSVGWLVARLARRGLGGCEGGGGGGELILPLSMSRRAEAAASDLGDAARESSLDADVGMASGGEGGTAVGAGVAGGGEEASSSGRGGGGGGWGGGGGALILPM
jgi:hypothetical protein